MIKIMKCDRYGHSWVSDSSSEVVSFVGSEILCHVSCRNPSFMFLLASVQLHRFVS